MLTTLILLTTAALPQHWELRTNVDVSYWQKASTLPAESLEHCERLRDMWVRAWGPIVRGEGGRKSAWCVAVRDARRHL